MLTEANHNSGLILREKTMTDYIKREDAVNLFEALADSLDTFEFRMAAIGAANELRKMPSMCFAPVRHGRWVTTYRYGFPIWECSECGTQTGTANFPYCYNCGARMDEEVDA